jgi:8-oxo-dGTP pyrophosphatase MutT (NUDIX family)
MALRPALTVAAVAERAGRFLVVEERIGGRRVFNQPAGHVEAGETLVRAVVRETLEETGWTFAPTEFIGAYLWAGSRGRPSTLRFAFCGEATGHDEARALDDDIVAAHWLTRTELAALGDRLRTPLVLRCIDDYVGGQRLPIAAVAGVG